MRKSITLAAALLGASAIAFISAAPSSSAGSSPAAVVPVANTYKVDLSHSNILFKCKHLGVSYQWGRFDSFAGSFTLDADAANLSVAIKVDADSVNSNNKDRDDHLRGPDFFDAKQFGHMTFESSKVAAKGDDVFVITGTLSLHGVKKEITFDVTKVGEEATKMGKRAGFEGHFVIDRMDYGIKTYPDMLGSDVTMHFAIEGVQG